ncbi:hypothetical protein LCV38_003044 [Escherichia coli]|nr:hypothetical protein [Escherichia coli]EIE0908321.1 hypothetical protein [Escherichia coli]
MSFKPNSELIHELKASSGLLIAKSKAIPFYNFFSKIGLTPVYSDVIEASHQLNLIASILEGGNNSYSSNPSPSGQSIYSSLKIIGEKLDIIVSY